MALAAAIAAVFSAATAEAQVVVGGQAVVIQRMQFGAGFGMAGMRGFRPVDEGSGLFPDDDFRRIGDPWWDDVAKDDAGAELPAVAREPAAGLPAVSPVADEQAVEKALDAGTLSREQREALHKESARLAAVTGMMGLRRELSAVRQIRPELDEQQRAIVLLAGRKALREGLAALAEKPLSRWGNDRKQALDAAVRDAIGAALAANDSDAARDAYLAEVTRRDERRKRAAVDALVAEIDRDMQLAAEERERLVAGLTESYREAWRSVADQYPQGLAAGLGMQQLPSGLDRKVEEILGKQRTAEWLARRPNAGGRPDGRGPLRIRAGAGNGVQVIIEGGAVEAE
jgi:hypothetical protein